MSTICTGGHHWLALTKANAAVLATLVNSSSTRLTRVGAGLSAKQTVKAPLPSAIAAPSPASAAVPSASSATPMADTRPLVK